MSEQRWRASVGGQNCPFCGARPENNQFWSKITTLSISSLYLHKTQTYRGYSVLIFDPRHATRPSDLAAEEWRAFCDDLNVSQRAIERIVEPDYMNLATLGNQIPHLHWHIIPRYLDDSRWGAPVWTTTEKEMRVARLSSDEHGALVEAIRAECDS